jgi:hypothetical protein
MNDLKRDPRVDPAAGDVLKIGCHRYFVVEGRWGAFVLFWVADLMRGNTCLVGLDAWRDAMRHAEVVHGV